MSNMLLLNTTGEKTCAIIVESASGVPVRVTLEPNDAVPINHRYELLLNSKQGFTVLKYSDDYYKYKLLNKTYLFSASELKTVAEKFKVYKSSLEQMGLPDEELKSELQWFWGYLDNSSKLVAISYVDGYKIKYNEMDFTDFLTSYVPDGEVIEKHYIDDVLVHIKSRTTEHYKGEGTEKELKEAARKAVDNNIHESRLFPNVVPYYREIIPTRIMIKSTGPEVYLPIADTCVDSTTTYVLNYENFYKAIFMTEQNLTSEINIFRERKYAGESFGVVERFNKNFWKDLPEDQKKKVVNMIRDNHILEYLVSKDVLSEIKKEGVKYEVPSN